MLQKLLAQDQPNNSANKKVIRNCAPFSRS